MKTRTFRILAIAALVSTSIPGCRRMRSNDEASAPVAQDARAVPDIEFDLKSRAWQDTSESRPIPLTVTRTIRSDEGSGSRFVYPVALVAHSDGGVYISDNNA